MKYVKDLTNWKDGINQVLCGDALELLKKIPDNSIDLVLTDPPYGIDYQSSKRVASKKFEKIENDSNGMRLDIYADLCRVLKQDSVCAVWCSWKNYHEDFVELKKYFDIKNVIVWHKPGGGIGDLEHSLSTDYELCIIAHKGKRKINGKRIGSVWTFSKVNPIAMKHPTQKPSNIICQLISCFSTSGTILDPFMGSWTTAKACQELGRNFIGCDLEEDYCRIGERRLNEVPLLTV